MEDPQNTIKALELKIKSLEIENQKLASTIEINNKTIKNYKTLIQSYLMNNTPKSVQANESNEIYLKFKWKVSDVRKKLICELTNDSKGIKKIGSVGWNCSAI